MQASRCSLVMVHKQYFLTIHKSNASISRHEISRLVVHLTSPTFFWLCLPWLHIAWTAARAIWVSKVSQTALDVGNSWLPGLTALLSENAPRSMKEHDMKTVSQLSWSPKPADSPAVRSKSSNWRFDVSARQARRGNGSDSTWHCLVQANT